jgi:thiamine-monophosphate kinase
MGEFELIERFFTGVGRQRDDVPVGVGDDAALLRPPAGQTLVASVDTLVAGVHFPATAEPESVGHKALAVNLSDLAAMGAEPAWVTLTLTLPDGHEDWVGGFVTGFARLAAEWGVQLVGGDTTRGGLTVTVQAMGFVPEAQALLRSGARTGDLIYVTGTLGDAGLALLGLQGELKLPGPDQRVVLERLERPVPRVAAGRALRGIASAAIDVSDGLAADLGHVLHASGVGAEVYAERLPISGVVRRWLERAGGWVLPLSAGDDYELCVTVPPGRQGDAEQAMAAIGCPFTWIGLAASRLGLRCVLDDGTDITPGRPGYDHFG